MNTASGLVNRAVRQLDYYAPLLALVALVILAVALAGAVVTGDLLPAASESELTAPARWHAHRA